MVLITISCFLAIGILFYSLKFFRNWINPVFYFFTPWLVVVFLLSFQLYRFRQISQETIFIIMITFIVFLLGVELIFLNRDPQVSFLKNKLFVDNQKRILQILIITFSLISLIAGLIILKRLLAAEGDIFRIIAKAAIIRRKIVSGELNIISYYGYFGSLAYLSMILSGIYAGKYGVFRFFSWISLLPVLLLSFVQMGRAHLLWGLLLYANAYILVYYVTGKRLFTHRRLLIYMVTFVLLLAIVNWTKYFRGGQEILLHYKKYLRIEEPDNMLMRAALSNYLYIVSPLVAFDVMIHNFHTPLVMGGKSFRPLIYLASKENKRVYYPFVRIPMPVNVYTYLADAFMDYGYAGFLLIPFLLGVLSSYTYFRFINEPNLFWLAMLSILYSQLEFSIFYSRFAFGNVWIVIFVLFLIRPWLEDEKK